MHEVSLVAALVDQIQEEARKQSFTHVLKIRLGIGKLSGVEAECLEFCFPEVVKGTILDGAALEMESEEIAVACKSCGKETICESPEVLICLHCLSSQVSVVKGREFRVIDLEVT
jgi:hydrogenase nickel incorporation protein HypA/HybF